MKRITLTLVSLLVSAFAAFADEEVQTEENAKVEDAVNSIAKSNRAELANEDLPKKAVWKFGGSIGINGAQTLHNSYSLDGKGFLVGVDGYLKLALELRKMRHKWANELKGALGFNYSSEYQHNPKLHTTLNELSYATKYGYRANKVMYYAISADLNTKILPLRDYDAIDAWYSNEYNIKNEDGTFPTWKNLDERYEKLHQDKKDTIELRGEIGNPLIVNTSLGIDLQPCPKEDFSIFISPISGRFTICKNDLIAEYYSMEPNVDDDGNTYKNVRSEIGAMLKIEYKKEFNKYVKLATGLEGFYSYNKSIKELSENIRKNYIRLPDDTYIDLEALEKNPTVKINQANLLLDEKTFIVVEDGKDGNYAKDGEYYNVSEYISDDYNINDNDWVEKHGWSARFYLDMEFQLTKVLTFAVRTQLKYNNAEVNYSQKIQEMRKDTRNLKKVVREKNVDGTKILVDKNDVEQLKNKDNNYGYKKPFLQFWESTTLGITYSF